MKRIHKMPFSNVPISFLHFHLLLCVIITSWNWKSKFLLKRQRFAWNEKYFFFLLFFLIFLLCPFYKNRNWWARHFELKMTIMDTFIPIYVFFNLSYCLNSFRTSVWSNFKCNTSTMNGTFETNFERVSVLWELFDLRLDSVCHQNLCVGYTTKSDHIGIFSFEAIFYFAYLLGKSYNLHNSFWWALRI